MPFVICNVSTMFVVLNNKFLYTCSFLLSLQGSPKLITVTGCYIYFEWETNIMCKHSETDPLPTEEVKCYFYDGYKRFDLSPLAMKKGGYLISSELNTDVYINVCRDINPSKSDTKYKWYIKTFDGFCLFSWLHCMNHLCDMVIRVVLYCRWSNVGVSGRVRVMSCAVSRHERCRVHCPGLPGV